MLDELDKGLVEQVEILGNHVAFVLNPRAGEIASIVDSKDNVKPKKEIKMSKKAVKEKLLKFIGIVDSAADQAAEELTSVTDADETIDEDNALDNEILKAIKDITTALAGITVRLDKLESPETAEVTDDDEEPSDAVVDSDEIKEVTDSHFRSKS